MFIEKVAPSSPLVPNHVIDVAAKRSWRRKRRIVARSLH